MTATFWTASAVTFTNGQKIATVTSGSPFNSSQSYANWKLSSGNKNEPVEVKSASGTQIELFDNWSGPSGSTTVTMEPSPAAAASAGAAAQALITQIQTLVNSASVTATANSFVKRDSGGRTKTATPSANDDAVNKAYLGSAATRNVAASYFDSDNDTVLRSFGPTGCFGLASTTAPSAVDANAVLKSGIYAASGSSAVNFPGDTKFAPYLCMRRLSSQDTASTFHIAGGGGSQVEAWVRRTTDNGLTWFEGKLYHSANTNFNEFGGSSGDVIALGVAVSATEIKCWFPLNSTTDPSSVSFAGSFSCRGVLGQDTGNNDITIGSLLLSSRKFGFISFLGLSGLEIDKIYRLQLGQSTSRITFNF